MSALEVKTKAENLSSGAHVIHATVKQSFHVVDRAKKYAKSTKGKNARAKRAKLRLVAVKDAKAGRFYPRQ